MATNVLTEHFSEPLNGATTAKVEIDAGYSNLTIDGLQGGEPALVSGTLQYVKSEDRPERTATASNGRATVTLTARGSGRRWLHVFWKPWSAATGWQIHLNPNVTTELAVRCDGGNVGLDLAGLSLAAVAADCGGGNVDVVLPDAAANLHVTAKTGAGNVTVEIGGGWTGKNTVSAGSGAGNVEVRIPSNLAARLVASSGLGKVSVPARFGSWSGKVYQSADYESAAGRVEITLSSGAGNVTVSER